MTDPIHSIAVLVKRLAGIDIDPTTKASLIEGRLGKRLRKLDTDLASYARQVEQDPAEQQELLDLLTTNHTSWLREGSHFVDLRQRLIPAVASNQRGAAKPRLRIWCAASATGEEPYGLAMTVAEALPDLARWDAAILATDISRRALAKAKAGIYDEERIAPLTPQQRELALELEHRGPPPVWRVSDRLRRLLTFSRLNLMEPWPMKGPFDAIFCRNVMIYFDRPTQERLVARMGALLAPHGTLYVGHSESLSGISHDLRQIGTAAYGR